MRACGHAKDVLQKTRDPLLTTCPACGAESSSKQVTAAGFQLKGRAGTPPISAAAAVPPCRRKPMPAAATPADGDTPRRRAATTHRGRCGAGSCVSDRRRGGSSARLSSSRSRHP